CSRKRIELVCNRIIRPLLVDGTNRLIELLKLLRKAYESIGNADRLRLIGGHVHLLCSSFSDPGQPRIKVSTISLELGKPLGKTLFSGFKVLLARRSIPLTQVQGFRASLVSNVKRCLPIIQVG